MSTRPEVIVAEDNPRDRQFLERLLPDFDLTMAGDGNEALAVACRREAPWLISDLQMPGMDGIKLASRLWHEQPLARIVFWSQHKDEMYVRALAKIIPPETVYGYVLKDNADDVIVKAVDAVFLEGQCWIDPKVRSVQARAHQNHSAISDAEYEVLIDIALGLTDNMIARRHYLSRRGAQSRLKSLYNKLGVDQEQFTDPATGEALNMRARAVAVALRRGLVNPFELEREEDRLQDWLKALPAGEEPASR
jgi:DNA-binding NarL/FixJ family response regulator